MRGRGIITLLACLGACVGDNETPTDGGADGTVDVITDTNDGSTDAADAAVDAGPRCDPTKPFANARRLDNLNAAGVNEGARLTKDENTAYFTSNLRDGGIGSNDTYIATRPNAQSPFTSGSLLNGGNTTDNDEWPTVTADGLHYYVGRYPGGNWDIFVASRAQTTDPFPITTSLASVSSTTANDVHPYVLPDNSALYFTSDRSGGNDLYRASFGADGGFNAAVLLQGTNLNTAAIEQTPVVTSDELVLYFSSDRSDGGVGLVDIYKATRASASAAWGAPLPVTELNTVGQEFPSWVSDDDCILVYTSTLTPDGGTSGKPSIWIAEKPK